MGTSAERGNCCLLRHLQLKLIRDVYITLRSFFFNEGDREPSVIQYAVGEGGRGGRRDSRKEEREAEVNSGGVE